MSFNFNVLAAVVAMFFAAPVMAGEGHAHIMVPDSYARVSTKMSTSGAAFMTIMNHGGHSDRLVDVRSDVAARVELHTHVEDENGVMKMMHVKEGFVLPEDGVIELKRGGNHIMFMGITTPFEPGVELPVTLVFEGAGEIGIMVPVDLDRKPGHGAKHDAAKHSDMKHGEMKDSEMKGSEMKDGEMNNGEMKHD